MHPYISQQIAKERGASFRQEAAAERQARAARKRRRLHHGLFLGRRGHTPVRVPFRRPSSRPSSVAEPG